MATNTTKMNLKRAYVYHGKDYGPGEVEVPNELKIGNDTLKVAEDLKAREDEYESHLKAGGEPIAPVTPSLSDGNNTPQNVKSLNTPSQTALQTTTAPSAQSNAKVVDVKAEPVKK